MTRRDVWIGRLEPVFVARPSLVFKPDTDAALIIDEFSAADILMTHVHNNILQLINQIFF